MTVSRGATVLLFGFAFVCATVFVSDSGAATEDVRALAEKYQETKKSLIDKEAEKRRILGSLYTINKRMKKISQEKGHLTDELFHVQGNVENLAKAIALLENQIAEQRTKLRARLRTLYKLSGENYMSVLFSQGTSHDLDRTLKFLKIVTDLDYRLIRSYQKNVAVYKQQRQRLKTQVERLVSLEKKIRAQETLLVQDHKTKSHIVSELETSQRRALSSIRKIRSRTQALQVEADSDEETLDLLKASFFEQKGQIPPPISGQVVEDFGLIRDDRFMIQLSHKGWQFEAPAGTAVSSVFEGTIVHSGWINGYGHTIVVDHGDHYYTVYAHIANPKVNTGDVVKRGQTIAEAGSTSRRHGIGMYFEIRHFSEPENPKHWLNGRGVPVSTTGKSDPVELATARGLVTE